MKQTCEISSYQDGRDRAGVSALWRAVFGYADARNHPETVIDKKLAAGDGLFWVARQGETLAGTVMAGYDGHRGWIYSLAVAPELCRQGIGSRLLGVAEAALGARGCVKINLQILADNAPVARFYERRGYVVEARISMGKQLPENIPGRGERQREA